MAIVKGIYATSAAVPKTTGAIRTPQQALNAIIKPQTTTITPTYGRPAAAPNGTVKNPNADILNSPVQTQATGTNVGSGAVLGAVLGAKANKVTPAIGSVTPITNPEPAEEPIADPAGGNGGGGNSGYTGYTNPRASGFSLVSGGSAPAVQTAPAPTTDVALSESPSESPFETRLKELLEQGNSAAKEAYGLSKAETDSYVEKALQEAYISRKLAERALPQQLAARGLNGGAVESILAGNQNSYMNSRNDIYRDANERLQEVLKTYNSNIANNQTSYMSTLADYLRQLELMDKEAAINKELAAYKSAL